MGEMFFPRISLMDADKTKPDWQSAFIRVIRGELIGLRLPESCHNQKYLFHVL